MAARLRNMTLSDLSPQSGPLRTGVFYLQIRHLDHRRPGLGALGCQSGKDGGSKASARLQRTTRL